ncbi:MAG TPA: hypothetical protein ENI15_07735 [Spirochaetes bacterium]|nr:hypothetical protein [Spirochaetota bacterium]
MYIIFSLITFFRSITGQDYARSFIQIKTRILEGFIFNENLVSFENMGDLYKLHFYETGSLLVESLIREREWLEILRNEGIFSGAYVRVGNKSYTVGSISTRQTHLTNGYYIDTGGLIHYVYSEDNGRIFFDGVIDLQFVENYFNDLHRKPSGILFYDRVNDAFCTVYGVRDPLSEKINWDTAGVNGSSKTFGFRKTFYIMAMNLTGSDIYLIANYPFVLGKKGLILIGLIVNFVLIILLLKSIGGYVLICLKESRARNIVMGQTGANMAVIREIDLEVSDITINKDKSPGAKQKSLSNLEIDGIFIKKA